jgi:hypothetical protein
MITLRWLGLLLLVGVAGAASVQPDDSLPVCIGADRVVKERQGLACAAGTTSYDLPLEIGEFEGPATEEDAALKLRLANLENKVKFLTAKIDQMAEAGDGGAKTGNLVVEPFEVVNKQGRTLLKVLSNADGGGQLELWNPSGVVAWGTALKGGGVFKTRAPGLAFPEVVMGSSGAYGAFTIRDAELKSRATMSLRDGKPSIEISGKNHIVIAGLRESSSGTGWLELGNAAGNGMVNAGVNDRGCGMVKTYPEQPVRATALGLPGDRIQGKC